MVARGRSRTRKSKSVSKQDAQVKKIRIGILVGKDFDPVKRDTQWPAYPTRFILTEDDWGKYSADVATAVKMQQLHPDLLEVDIISGKEIKQARLQRNHVNLNFWGDIGVAMLRGGKRHIEEVTRCHKNPSCRLYPSWDSYDWIVYKPRYMEQCKKAGIPMIPTVIYKNGFDPVQCMTDVDKMKWEKFIVKVGHFAFFGAGALHGKAADFHGKRAKELQEYARATKKSKTFLVQPYILKPNGDVFDEVRNFFIDGQWRYSVFTHGTDETDEGYYEEPEGPRKVAAKALAERAYQEVLKAWTWQGKRLTPLLMRIDIAVIPRTGSDSLHRTDNTYLMNEIEMEATTWLDRYSPISVPDVVAQASVKKVLELLVGLINAKRRVPEEAHVKRAITILDSRLGPFRHLKVKA